MKLISTLFQTSQLDICMMIQNRNVRGKEEQDGPLISKYVSRVGNESLIFNPSVAISITSRVDKSLNAYIPLSLFYRFTGNLTAVYSVISDNKLYRTEGNVIYVDKKKALEVARKLPLFRNTLTLVPDVHVDRANTFTKGIAMLVEMKAIGIINHQEALGLIEQLDHLDITSYTLMAGIVDELESANTRLDSMMDMLQKIYELLQKKDISAVIPPPIPSPVDEFNWKPTIDWRPMT